jgi:hypothetical protein
MLNTRVSFQVGNYIVAEATGGAREAIEYVLHSAAKQTDRIVREVVTHRERGNVLPDQYSELVCTLRISSEPVT